MYLISQTQELKEPVNCERDNGGAWYPGGSSAWAKHVRKHKITLQAPCESGKLFVSFKVLKSGLLDSIQIRKGQCELADKSAIETVKTSGFWHPQCLNGKPIDSWVSIPFTFQYK